MLNWEIVIFILLLLHFKLYLLADVFLFGRNNLFVYFWRCIFKQMYFADEEPPCENAIKYHHYYYYYYYYHYYFISLVQHIFVADGSLVNIFWKNFFDLAAASLEIETERDFYSLFLSIHLQCESSECHVEATHLLDQRKRSCLHFLQVCIKRCSLVVRYFSFECKIHSILCSFEKTNMFYMVRSKSLLSKVVECVKIVQTL